MSFNSIFFSFLNVQNKFLVRFFVSYHLHKYRLVSVIHRINAAFGVSSKFVPYRPNYDLVVSLLPICKYVDTSVSSSYSLISSLPCTITEPGFYRITATQNYYNTEPRGLIISDSNSDYSSYHAFSKAEVSERVNNLSTSFTIYAVSSSFYVWAKSSANGTNRITLTVERLG